MAMMKEALLKYRKKAVDCVVKQLEYIEYYLVLYIKGYLLPWR